MSRTEKQSKLGSAGSEGTGRAFLCIRDLLVSYGQEAPGRNAILALGGGAVTYGALLVSVNGAIRALRSLGVGRGDRVAVVLPNGPETAVALISVASGAVCVPLNPGYTADEWQRYFGDLRIAALLTRADMDSSSRGVAHALGIPIIDLVPRPDKGLDAFSFVGSATQRSVTEEPAFVADAAQSADDAFILLTSGTTSRPKMVALTHASVCLSAHNAAAALALRPHDRLLNVLSLFHAHGLISGLLAALAAGSSVVVHAWLRCWGLFRLAHRISADLVHRGPGHSSGGTVGGGPPSPARR